MMQHHLDSDVLDSRFNCLVWGESKYLKFELSQAAISFIGRIEAKIVCSFQWLQSFKTSSFIHTCTRSRIPL